MNKIDWSDVQDYHMHPECRKILNSEYMRARVCRLCLKRSFYELGTDFGQIPTSRFIIAGEEAGQIAS